MHYRKALADYFLKYPGEKRLERQVLRELGGSDAILLREHEAVHLSASALVLSPNLDKVLLACHNIYGEYGWLGGHADGEADLLQVACREVLEESGIVAQPLCGEILSVEFLPVPAHEKQGQQVVEHRHLNVSFVFIASPQQLPRVKLDENSAVAWFNIEEMDRVCAGEPQMLPIYHRLIERAKKELVRQRRERETDLEKMVRPLLSWYAKNARDLPWRENTDPYRVWISEIMLQQTRVEAVIPYFQRFLAQLPDVFSLAKASEEQLMKLWEGLGYYSRARNLQRAAKVVAQEMGGVFPTLPEELSKLPGIGEYTAGAIASIAFEQPAPAVDGNVLRVLSRLTEDERDVLQPAVKREMSSRLQRIYPETGRGDFTQALMELGATVCLPNGAPLCEKCPVRFMCKACEHGTAEKLPVKSPKKARKQEKKTVFLIYCEGKVAIGRRPKTGLLAGMWEFPSAQGHLDGQSASQQLADWGLEVERLEPYKQAVHVFTHVEWDMTSYRVWCRTPDERFTWALPVELISDLALPSAFKAFFAAVGRR